MVKNVVDRVVYGFRHPPDAFRHEAMHRVDIFNFMISSKYVEAFGIKKSVHKEETN